MNERLIYAIKRLQTEKHSMVYEGADCNGKTGAAQWFVYPSIWPQTMHTLTKRDLDYLLRHEWIVPHGEYFFRRGPTALIYTPSERGN